MIKLDIISGFLGAGKTTFIRKILKAFEKVDEKIVVIVNEFGDIGIDGDLIKRDGYELYEISKGCLCCSLKEDFSLVLEKLAGELSPDRVLLEPSGIFVVQEAFEIMKQDRLVDKYTIDNLITIVDSLNFYKSYERTGLFLEKQIQSASKLLLSKTQYLKPEEIHKIVKKLRVMNEKAKIYEKNWQQYIREEIIDIIIEQGDKSCVGNGTSSPNSLKHDYSSFGMKTQMIFDDESVKKLLLEIKNRKYGKIIRSKGVLLGKPHNFEFQYIEGSFNIDAYENNIKESKMVFIGEDIKKKHIKMKYYKTGGPKNVNI